MEFLECRDSFKYALLTKNNNVDVKKTVVQAISLMIAVKQLKSNVKSRELDLYAQLNVYCPAGK